METVVQKAEKVGTSYNQLYLGGMVLAMLFFLLDETTLTIPPDIKMFLKLLPMLLLSLCILSAFSQYSLSGKILALLTMVISIIVGVKSDHLSQLYVTYALVFGAKGISAKKIFSVYFKASAFFCVVIVCMALCGFIENLVIVTESRENIFGDIADSRNCYGYIWPTDFATHVFFILMTYWILKDGKLGIIMSFVYFGIAYVMLVVTDSRLGCGCIVLLLASSFLLRIAKVLTRRRTEAYSKIRLSFLLVFWIPFLAILSIYATIKYDSTDIIWQVANLILSGRLGIGQEAIENDGIPLLGQKYRLYGGETNSNLYNFIDSSYIQLLVIYGVVYMLLVILAYYYLAYRSYRFRENTILAALFVAGISGAIAQHFIQFFMNPLLFLLFADRDLFFPENSFDNHKHVECFTSG